tara:strand:- start:35 stop:196 length:162 start_codon:yes stop_codon:yes gene_type:complete
VKKELENLNVAANDEPMEKATNLPSKSLKGLKGLAVDSFSKNWLKSAELQYNL